MYPLKRKNYIVNVGRFIKSKNQRELIDIFTLVNDGSWKLIFVGDGPCRKECMDYVSQKGISSYVEFVGVVKDVDRYLAQSKIFAFVSTSEGFPNALGEAVLFPTASISYNCPAGPEDIIRDDENGFLVPLGKVEEYATKLKMLMESEELRTRFEMNAVSDRSKYSMENIGESFFNFMF